MIIRQHMFPMGRQISQGETWLLALFAVLLTGRRVAAQKNDAKATTTSQTPQATGDDDAGATDSATQDNDTNTTTSPTTEQTSKSDAKTTGTVSSTDLPKVSSSTSSAALPALTSSAALPSLTTTALPKITQNTSNIPTYQVVIPQMDGNPFLQTSSLPEGTVFIVVGSCLAGIALILIFSRAVYIWFLHRQSRQWGKDVKYSEMEQRPFTAPTTSNPFAGISGGGNISLEYLRPIGGEGRSSTYSSRPSTARPQTTGTLRPTSAVNLLSSSNAQFYSPSANPAGAAAAALGSHPAARDSGYLPAGYYLREPTTSSTLGPSPTKMYTAPQQSSFLYSDPNAPPMSRLSRSPATNTVGGTARPSTGGASPPGGGGYGYGGQGYDAPRRSSQGADLAGGDRRSRPSQVLDDLLGG